jgi:two-component system sensor kinase FixL
VLGRISDEAVRAGDMIHGLKALVRKRRSELRVCNVNHLVCDVLPLAEVEARPVGIAIELDLQDDLPEVVADDVQVQQVVLNLLRNAIEAQPEAGVVRVVSRSLTGGLVEVEVADDGPGLAAEDAEKIFQPFFSTKQEGMGMGLSISRSIIDAHGGEIGYRPGAQGGSVFYFRLPSEPSALALARA